MSQFSSLIVHINECIYNHVSPFNKGILNDKNFGKKCQPWNLCHSPSAVVKVL